MMHDIEQVLLGAFHIWGVFAAGACVGSSVTRWYLIKVKHVHIIEEHVEHDHEDES